CRTAGEVAALRESRKSRGLQLNVSFSDARLGSRPLFLLADEAVTTYGRSQITKLTAASSSLPALAAILIIDIEYDSQPRTRACGDSAMRRIFLSVAIV